MKKSVWLIGSILPKNLCNYKVSLVVILSMSLSVVCDPRPV